MNQLTDYQIVNKYSELFERMKDTPQDPVHHQEGNVYVHTEMVLNALLALPEFEQCSDFEKEVLIYTALFHDVCKPDTIEISAEGRISNPRHAAKGANLVRQILDKEKFDFEMISKVFYMVYYHGYPLRFFDKEQPLKSAIKLSLLANNHLLYIFAKADLLGRICEDSEKLMYDLDCFKEFCLENGIYNAPKQFHSDFDRFYYFNQDDSFPDTQIFHQFDFEIFMMVGIPASGKDTYIKKNFAHLPIISLDQLRQEMKVKPTDNQGAVIQAAKEKSKEFCRRKQSFVWNATNITKNMRSTLVGLWLPYNPKINMVFTYKNIDKTLKDNEEREQENKIPNSKIVDLFAKLEFPDLTECHVLKKPPQN
ncbi:MAG: AAA family ATPase [Thermoflexibacter sp.]|jgi:putative nucleotidyltransferase with HDIG domain|nr:AAA family ATPase [Thermoflexibacter sp.]